jgi:hypothetical protein
VLLLNECLLLLCISLPTQSEKSPDSSVGIALGYGLDDRGSRVQFPAGTGNFSLHHRVQNGSGAHPASYPTGTRVFPWEKSGRDVKLTTHLHLVPRPRIRGAIPPLPTTPPWRGTQLKYRDNFTFTFLTSDTTQRSMKREDNCEGRSGFQGDGPRGLFQVSILEFSRRYWGKPR